MCDVGRIKERESERVSKYLRTCDAGRVNA